MRHVTRLSELSSVTSARLPKTRQVPDAGLIRPSGASVSRPITKPVKVLSARKERSQDGIRTRIHPLFNGVPLSPIQPPDYFACLSKLSTIARPKAFLPTDFTVLGMFTVHH